MAEETNAVKFTDEELQSLQGLQEKYTEKQGLLGQLAVQRLVRPTEWSSHSPYNWSWTRISGCTTGRAWFGYNS